MWRLRWGALAILALGVSSWAAPQQFPVTVPPRVIVESGTTIVNGLVGSFTVVFSTTQHVLAYPTGVTSTTQAGPFTVVQNSTARTLTGTVSTTQVSPFSVVVSGTGNVLAYPTGVYATTQSGPFSVVQNATARTLTGVVSTSAVGSGLVVVSGTANVLAYHTGVYATTVIGPLTTSVASGTSNVLAYPTGVYATTQIAPFTVVQNSTARTLTGVVSTTQAGPFSVVTSGTSNVLAYPTGVYATTQNGPFSVIQSGTARTLTGTVNPATYLGKTLTYVPINQGAAGTTVLAAAQGSNKHKLVGLMITMSLLGTAKLTDGVGDLVGPTDIAATGGFVLSPSLIPWTETGAINRALNLVTTLGAARGVAIILSEP